MSIATPLCLQLTCINVSSLAPNNSNNVYQIQVTLPGVGQTYYSQKFQQYLEYTCDDIKPGIWIAGSSAGFAWKVIQRVSTNGPYDVTINIEDVDNFNVNIDNQNNAFGGAPQLTSTAGLLVAFTVTNDGLPVFSPSYNLYTDSVLPQLAADILSRFNAQNPARQYIDVNQASHTLLIGDPIWYNPTDTTGQPYEKAIGTNAKYTFGIVSNTGVPDANSFTFKVFGTYYTDIGSFFSESITPSAVSLATIPGIVPGSILYIDTTGTNQYTLTAPTDTAIPIWIYLGLDPVTGKETGILMPFGGSGSGGGGSADLSQIIDADPSGNILTKKITLNYSASKLTITGIGSTFLLKASHPNSAANFDFQNANVIMSSNFGTTYIPRYVLDGSGNMSPTPTDGTGFTVILNQKYTMANIPMIVGTVAYWAGTFMIYSQLKFGSSTGTTNSAQALLIPSNPLTSTDSSGNLTYGAPLKLSIAGLSITSGALGSARNMSTTAPLNYAMQVYLEILN